MRQTCVNWARPTIADGGLRAEANSPQGGSVLYRIKSLAMAGAVLHLGSHPDDEESGMLAWMARRHGVRTVYWSATRGEGAQNRRGPDKGDALGIIRTFESLEARGVDGGEVLYGPFRDFGFSKSGRDTLARWGRDDVIREIVRAIRMVQPMVVVCRWNGDAGDGHGHHQAIGLVAAEAFEAAADRARYGELTEAGLAAWRASKLYRSVSGDWQPGEQAEFGCIVENHERAGYLRIDAGKLDPLSGRTYQEQAHLAMNRHLSQGMSFVPEPGAYYYYYRLDRGGPVSPAREHDFFDGLDPTLTGLADGPGRGSPLVRSLLQKARQSAEAAFEVYHPQRPAEAARHLAVGLSSLRELASQLDRAAFDLNDLAALEAVLARRVQRFETVLAECLGLRVECLLSVPRLTPGGRVRVTVRAWNSGEREATIDAVHLQMPLDWTSRPVDAALQARGLLPNDAPFEKQYDVELPASEPYSTPYWLRQPGTPYKYAWPGTGPLGLPLDPPLVTAALDVDIGTQRCRLQVPAVHRSGIMGGFREIPLSVLPAIAVAPRQVRELLPLPGTDTRLELDVSVRCIEETGARATLRVSAPPHWTVTPAEVDLAFVRGGDSKVLRFDVMIPAGTPGGVYQLRYEHDELTAAVEFEPVRIGMHGNLAAVDETNCVAEVFQTRPAMVQVHLIDAKFVRTHQYAYVHGLKEDLLASLARFGLNVRSLSDEDLAFADLKAFQTIVIGPNAYNSRAALRKNAARLLDYVADGGVLLVQYQGYGYDADGLAPYPFRYNEPHDRVTVPDAPVHVLQPNHPVFHEPNAIAAADFDGWITDRGLYFFGEWSREYVPLLASSDRGEESKGGGLVVAPYGRGTFLYAAYSFFRQIPVGVPGALRLFANLLGLAEARIRQRMEFLRSIELFAFMPDDQLYEAARMMYERRVEAGRYLARQGDRGSELFIVAEGSIDVVNHLPDGERVVHTACRGDAIGEFAILANIPRTASLRAQTDVTIIVLPAKAFQDWIRRYPDLSLRVMELLVRKIVGQSQNN